MHQGIWSIIVFVCVNLIFVRLGPRFLLREGIIQPTKDSYLSHTQNTFITSPNPLKSQPITSSNQSKKVSSKYHQLRNPISQPGVGETLGLIHPEVKFFSICGSVKLENKLSVPQIQWWDRQRIAVTDIPIPKRRGERERREGKGRKEVVTAPKQFQNPTKQGHWVSGPGNNPLWLKALSSQ